MTDAELKYIEEMVNAEALANNMEALKKIRDMVQAQIATLGLSKSYLKDKLELLCTELHSFLGSEPMLSRQHLCLWRATKKRTFADGVNHRQLYVFDLVKCTEDEIMSYPGVGEVTMVKLNTYLESNGLSLGIPISMDEERELIRYAKAKDEREIQAKTMKMS